MDCNNFRFWCQKILPLVYDDSLSYYEVLCKVTKVMNDLINKYNGLPEYVETLVEPYLKEFTDNVLTNVVDEKVSEIVTDEKLFGMVEEALNGYPFNKTLFTSQLGENVTDVEINAALTQYDVVKVVFDKDVTLANPINVKSNMQFVGAGGVITYSGTAFSGSGTLGTVYTFEGNSHAEGEQTLTCTDTPPSVGTVLSLRGSTNVISNNSPEVARAGGGTANYLSCFAGQYATVVKTNGNAITIQPQLNWYYGAVTAKVIDLITNVVFEGLVFKYTKTDFLSNCISVDYCENITIKNCEFSCCGYAINLRYPTNALIAHNQVVSNGLNAPTNSSDNLIHIIGGQSCVIDGNKMEGGTQPIDITFDERMAVDCCICNNTVSGSTGQSITTHGACVRPKVTNNQCSNSIWIRGREIIIIGNTVVGTDYVNRYGIAIGDGCFTDSVIANNVIKNHSVGVAFYDNPDYGGKLLSKMSVIISGNVINGVGSAIYPSLNSDSEWNFVFSNNVIYGKIAGGTYCRLLYIPTSKTHNFDAVIIGNTFSATDKAVLLNAPTGNYIVSNNKFICDDLQVKTSGSAITPVMQNNLYKNVIYNGAQYAPANADVNQLRYSGSVIQYWNGTAWADVT